MARHNKKERVLFRSGAPLFLSSRALQLLSGYTPSKGSPERQATETYVETTVVFDADLSGSQCEPDGDKQRASNGNKKESLF